MNSGVPGSATTSSKPAGVIDFAIVRITSGWLGAKRIFLAISVTSLLGERNRRGHHGLLADHARGVALTGGVLDQARIAGTEHVLGAVAQPDLELAGQDDDELAARRRVPVEEPTHRPHAERDLRRRQSLQPVVLLLDVDLVDPPLSIRPRVQPERSHVLLPSASLKPSGMLAYEAIHDRSDAGADVAHLFLPATAPALRRLGEPDEGPAADAARRPRPLPELGLDGHRLAR